MKTFAKKRLFERSSVTFDSIKGSTTGVLANGLLYTIPKGYTIEYIVFVEKAGGAVTIKVGTAALGSDLIWSQAITPSVPTTVTLDYTHSMTANQAIYISDTGAGWGTAVLDVYISLQKV